jgi:probable F420-dependent oxidoreductase
MQGFAGLARVSFEHCHELLRSHQLSGETRLAMELWLELGSVATHDLVDVAIACDQAHIAGVSLSDHLVWPSELHSAYPYSEDGSIMWEASAPWPDAWVAIAAMASATRRLRFATGVFVGPLREPLSLAKAVSTAAILSNDRLVCGLGVGWLKEEFDAVGSDFMNRGSRLDELVIILRQLWTGESVEHSGRHYSFAPVRMIPAPKAPIPIWIGGNSSAARRRAVGQEGWICAYRNIEQATSDLRAVRALRAAHPLHGERFATAVVGPIRRAETLRRLEDEGFDAVIVPIAMLAKGGRLADWRDAVNDAARLAVEAGLRPQPRP